MSGESWTNWSGGLTRNPDIEQPTDEAGVQDLVRHCIDADRTIRPVGAGHSWTPVAASDDLLVSLDSLSGVVEADREERTATIRGGTVLEDAATALQDRKLAMTNLGDVSQQTVAGAFATGTHGTGERFPNLSDMLIGGRLVTGTGEVRSFDAENDVEFLRAARVSLGTLGIFTELRLDLEPAFKVQRREYCTSFDAFWPDFERLIGENRHFDFYWYPRSDEVKLRLLNAPGGGTDPGTLSYATLVKDTTGWWHQTIPEHDEIGRKFEEMEYAIPRERARPFIEDVRERIRGRWRQHVGWRTLCRTVAADDAYLSAEHDRDSVTMGFIQNVELDYGDYFSDIEAIALEYDGRPHWGKRHTLSGQALADRYPRFEDFLDVRSSMDPHGVFLSPYLEELLGVPATASGAG